LVFLEKSLESSVFGTARTWENRVNSESVISAPMERV